jgi:hypothetical protein
MVDGQAGGAARVLQQVAEVLILHGSANEPRHAWFS